MCAVCRFKRRFSLSEGKNQRLIGFAMCHVRPYVSAGPKNRIQIPSGSRQEKRKKKNENVVEGRRAIE